MLVFLSCAHLTQHDDLYFLHVLANDIISFFFLTKWYIYIFFFSLSKNFFKDESKLFQNKTGSFVFCSIVSSQNFL
jgi:hypothetical protein